MRTHSSCENLSFSALYFLNITASKLRIQFKYTKGSYKYYSRFKYPHIPYITISLWWSQNNQPDSTTISFNTKYNILKPDINQMLNSKKYNTNRERYTTNNMYMQTISYKIRKSNPFLNFLCELYQWCNLLATCSLLYDFVFCNMHLTKILSEWNTISVKAASGCRANGFSYSQVCIARCRLCDVYVIIYHKQFIKHRCNVN